MAIFVLKNSTVLTEGAELRLSSASRGSQKHRLKTILRQEFMVCWGRGGGWKGKVREERGRHLLGAYQKPPPVHACKF